MKKAVVLLSGGLDSATTLAIAREEGFTCYALTVDYGQRHRHELGAAAAVASRLRAADHQVVVLRGPLFGGSALTTDLPVPKGRSLEAISEGIPSTYVPARNTVFLSLALAWAESLGATDLFIGANAVDYSGYPDCRPDFLDAFGHLCRLATKAGAEGASYLVHAPLLKLSKAEIIRRGHALGVEFGFTSSCYDPSPGGLPCGRCDACLLRAKGFLEAGLPDPLLAPVQ